MLLVGFACLPSPEFLLSYVNSIVFFAQIVSLSRFLVSFGVLELFAPSEEPTRFGGELELVWALFFGCGFRFVCLGWWVNRLLPLFAFSQSQFGAFVGDV